MRFIFLQIFILLLGYSDICVASKSKVKINPDISKINIPFLWQVSVISLSANNTITDYKKDYGLQAYGAGTTLELPLPGINSMLGATGFLSLNAKDKDNADLLAFYAAYIGVAFSSFDFIFGPAAGSLIKNLKGTYSSPDYEVRYDSNLTGGFIGLRKNFTNSGVIDVGFAIKAFYLSGDGYKKSVENSGGAITRSHIEKETSSSGAYLELIFSAGKQRKYENWLW